MEIQQQQSTECAMDRCTDDILLNIFDVIIGSAPDFRRGIIPTASSTSVLPLCGVCSRWRSIALSPSYTSLWSRICTPSRVLTQLLLERSGESPLDVQLDDSQCELLDLVKPHSARLGQLHLNLAETFNYVVDDLVFEAPRLHALTVNVWSGRAVELKMQAPSVRKLALMRVEISRRNGFVNLTHLSVFLATAQFGELLHVLEDNKNLQELILRCKDSRMAPRPSSRRICLPSLLYMSLSHCAELLQCFELSPRAAIRVVSLMPPVSSITKIHIRGTARTLPDAVLTAVDEHMLYTTFSNPSLFVEDSGLRGTQAFDDMLQQIIFDGRVFSDVRELWLYECQLPPRLATWRSVLGYMPSLREISIGPGLCTFLLNALMPDENGQVVCPALCTIRLLHSIVSMEKLTALVRDRKTRGVGLRTLEVYSVVPAKEDVISVLRESVEEVNVFVQPFTARVPVMEIPARLKEYGHDGWESLKLQGRSRTYV